MNELQDLTINDLAINCELDLLRDGDRIALSAINMVTVDDCIIEFIKDKCRNGAIINAGVKLGFYTLKMKGVICSYKHNLGGLMSFIILQESTIKMEPEE